MKQLIMVTKEILELYYKYEGDFGLLDEPWVDKKDKKIFNYEQAYILGSYIEKLEFIKLNNISSDLRNKTILEIEKLELQIEPEVIIIVKEKNNKQQ